MYKLEQVNTMKLRNDWDIFVYMYLTGLYSNEEICTTLGMYTSTLYDPKGWKLKYKKLIEDVPHGISVRRAIYKYDEILNFIDSRLLNESKPTMHNHIYEWLGISYAEYNKAKVILEEKYGEYITPDISEEELSKMEGALYVEDKDEEGYV